MVKFLNFCYSVVGLFASCTQLESGSIKGKEFNRSALNTFMENINNLDSIKYSIKLMDSAIQLEPHNVNYYISEAQMQSRIKEYQRALALLNKSGEGDSNFKVFFLKGQLYSLLNKKDSSFKYFNKSLHLLENNSIGDQIFIDSRKLIMYHSINDSLEFKKKYKEFRLKYYADKKYDFYNNEILQQIENK